MFQWEQLRISLAWLLLALLALPLFAGGLAGDQSVDSSLPACCRRNGAHHCAMTMAERSRLTDSRTPGWRAPYTACPYCPAAVPAWHPHGPAHLPTAQAVYAGYLAHPGGTVQSECKRRIAADRARGKRGPPLTLL